MRIKFLFPLALALALVLTSACQTLSPTPAPAPQPAEQAPAAPNPVAGATGMIYGSNHSYTLTAPLGWVLDNQAMAAREVFAVFYRVGEKWPEPRIFMYSTFAPFSDDPATNLDTPAKLAEWNLKKFQALGSRAVGKHHGEIRSDSGEAGEIWSFEVHPPAPRPPQFERVAYFPAPTGIVIIVATAMEKTRLDASIGAFDRLAKSYRWLASRMVLP